MSVHPFVSLAPITPPGSMPGMPGLCPGQLHELHAGAQAWAAALAFALTAAPSNRAPLMLVRCPRRAALPLQPYGEGLLALGIDPARLLIVVAPDEMGLLRAGLEAARCRGLAALVLESWGKLPAYDLTASRRLVLAAERSGVPVILLRLEASPRASAAHSRWLIRGMPSRRLIAPIAADTPGTFAIEAELLRQRGGPAGRIWQLEWSHEHAAFRNRPIPPRNNAAPLSGSVVFLDSQREGPRGGRAA